MLSLFARRIAWAILFVGVGASIWLGLQRHRTEARNRRVEMCIDLIQVRALATTQGVTSAAILRRFKALGVTSVGVSELTVAEMCQTGLARLTSNGAESMLLCSSREVADQIASALEDRGLAAASASAPPPNAHVTLVRYEAVAPGDLGTPVTVAAFLADAETLLTVGTGLAKQDCAEVQRAGLRIVARLGNYPGAGLASMTASLRSAWSLGARSVIFTGTEVMGFRSGLPDAADALTASGLTWGQVEFGKQKGDERLAELLKGRFLRVHSIAEAELSQIAPSEAVERFVRAARERNIRLCYVRLPFLTGPDPVGENLAMISAISGGLGKRGEMATGPAKLLGEPAAPVAVRALAGLGAGAAVVLVLLAILGEASAPVVVGLLLVALAMAAGGVAGHTGAKAAALIAAVACPTLAGLRLLSGCGAVAGARTSSPIAAGLKGLLGGAALSAAGGLLVVGLLCNRDFMLHTEQFAGIKLAHALPVLLVALAAVTGLPGPGESLRAALPSMRTRVADFLASRIHVGMLAGAMVALVALAFAVARTGNDPGIGVSGWELRLRSILDALLIVRPRTKEFLIGHPLIFLGAAYAATGRRTWAPVLTIVGMLGLVSIVNTFCHIHTPVHLSAARVTIGLILGCAIGCAAWPLLGRRTAADQAGTRPTT
ncbi:MAG: DUF5693 family protein [Armatimonadetes bacterium]|nr:DUF5693 family protein [Armatimonadota bacterium]